MSNTLCVFLTTSGGSTYGTVYDLAANAVGTTTLLMSSAGVKSSAMLTASTGIVLGATSVAFSVSGTTIAPGAPVTVVGMTLDHALLLSPTQAALVGHTGVNLLAAAISIAGTTLNIGAATTVAAMSGAAAAPVSCPPIARSATQIIGVAVDTGSGVQSKAWHATIAGTVVTANSSVNFGAAALSTTNHSNLVSMALDEWWLVEGGSGVWKLTVTGANIAAAAGGTAAGIGFSTDPAYPRAAKLNATTLYFYNITGGANSGWYTGTMSAVAPISQNAVTASTATAITYAIGGLPSTHIQSGSMLSYWDETFPGAKTSKKAAIAVPAAENYMCATFGTKDYLFPSSANLGMAYMVDKAGGNTPYLPIAIPPQELGAVGLVFMQSTNKLAWHGPNGRFYCCEVAL
ncbi:MAG: hypothetical protein V4488_26220 [Pseudomonadota bacterium]